MQKLFLFAAALSVSVWAADHIVTPVFQPESIMFEPNVAAEQFTLKVSGPDDLYFEIDFLDGELPFLEVNHEALPDGQYTFEIVATPKNVVQKSQSSQNRGLGLDEMKRGSMVYSGYFRVYEGSLVMPLEEPHYSVGDRGNLNQKNDENSGGEIPIDWDITPRDQVFADDLIVQSSACIGMDCVNGESFGFDTLRLKENNLRIRFMDTSNSGSFPTRDWQITANDSTNGGADKFSIDDIDGGRTPFTIEASAPSNSLYVDDAGNIGLGTATPSVEVHVVDGDSPTLRLEQNGSSGFQAQTWDIAGNESNFFVRDVTNGSELPFRIEPGADDNNVYIDSTNRVGIHTNNPSAPFHVLDTLQNSPVGLMSQTGNTQNHILQLAHTNSTVADRAVLELHNFGGSRINFVNNNPADSLTWRFGTEDVSNSFVVTKVGSGNVEMELTETGNLTVQGTVMGGSSRAIKENINLVNPQDILDAVANLPIAYWNYTADENDYKHVGPMAEDFWQTFGIGINDKTIAPSDMSGVALASIKALNTKLEEKEARINQLQSQNQELLKRLEAIEAALAQ